MGLRQKQKLDRNRRIVTAAAGLFREYGYESLHMEEIAERANVSVGTLYNYYESKADILIAVVSLEVNEVVADGQGVLENPPEDPLEAIDALFNIYLRHSLLYLSKDMWRAAMALSIMHHESEFGRHYAALDEKLCDQVCSILSILKSRGKLRPDAQTEILGNIAFSSMNALFSRFVREPGFDIGDLIREVKLQTRAIIGVYRAENAIISMHSDL